MGQIFDRFRSLQFHNEAEVSQNFLFPLLSEFLGYRADEILPEHLFPAFIPQNRGHSISSDILPRKAKPDHVVVINGRDRVLVCDSKGPDENIDDHLDQLIAYCIALRTNLLLITNGTELRVYDANALVFQAKSVEELDIGFTELHKLLNRSDAAKYTDVERIQTLDLSRSLGKDSETLQTEYHRRVAVALSDFEQYLDEVSHFFATLELATPIRQAFECGLQRFPAERLYSFQEYTGGDYSLGRPNPISYRTILQETPVVPLLLVGESGIGKTSLLQQILLDQARACCKHDSDIVPVLVKLGHYSHSRSVLELILNALVSKGVDVSPDRLVSLLRKGRFIILLDAFDEVFEPGIPELERELQLLINDYSQNKIIITTRRFRLPMITPVRRYEVQPLSREKIEAFAQMYLGSDSEAFLEEITRRGLAKPASNTLLLTLLVLLYLREGELPRSRGQILQAVVGRVHEWDQHKPKRFSSPLPWKEREELLARLAFSTLSSGKSYVLDNHSVEVTLNDVLGDLESRRVIPTGLTMDQVLNGLAATGFVLRMDEGIAFWHRAFQEYFASIEVAYRVESTPSFLEKLVRLPDWEEVLPLAAFTASEPSSLVEKLLSLNVFAVAQALIEIGQTEGDVHQRTVDALITRCGSATRPIRQMAVGLLRQLEGDYADKQLYELLDSEFVHMQKVALVEVTRRKLSDARALVFSRLDWNLPTSLGRIWEGPSGVAVIEALGEFDDAESHLQIISMWRERPDVYTHESCRNAFIKIAKRGKISDSIKQALLDFYLSDNRSRLIKMKGLADVLIALGDSGIVPRLVSSLRQAQRSDNAIRAFNTAEVLASFDEPGVVQQLVVCASDRNLDSYARSRFVEALSKSKGMVPLPVFEALVQDENDDVKSYGIRGLKRFPFEDVQTIVLQAVHPPSYEQSLDSRFSYARVQAAVFELLAQYDRIELLLEEEHRPEYFYNTSVDVLLEIVSSRRLHSMIPLLERIVEQAGDERSIIRAAWVLTDLGHVSQAQETIERLRQEKLTSDWVAHDILAGVHRLPAPYALGVVDEVLSRIEETEREDGGYLKMLCIEALTGIGTVKACERLAQIVQSEAEDTIGIDAEYALRCIGFLAPRDKEDWLLQLVKERSGMERTVLKRALDILGIIGGQNSLPLLQEYFGETHPDDIRATCFWAIQAIHRRAGQLWFNDEERGL